MRRIEALKEVQALIGETYMYAVIIGIIAVVLAFMVANAVKWQGGKNPKGKYYHLVDPTLRLPI